MPARRSYQNAQTLPCGCTYLAEHKSGDRYTICGGHNIQYVIRARSVTTVTYEIEVDTARLFG